MGEFAFGSFVSSKVRCSHVEGHDTWTCSRGAMASVRLGRVSARCSIVTQWDVKSLLDILPSCSFGDLFVCELDVASTAVGFRSFCDFATNAYQNPRRHYGLQIVISPL